MSRASVSLAATLLTLAGCADPAGYPTLAPRPIEQVSLAEPRPGPATPAVPAAQADARFAPALARVRSGDAAFQAALVEARPVLAAGRGAAVGSDAWGAAQQRLSRLQALRQPVAAALSDLQGQTSEPDALADAGLAAAGARAIAAARAIHAAQAEALKTIAPRAS